MPSERDMCEMSKLPLGPLAFEKLGSRPIGLFARRQATRAKTTRTAAERDGGEFGGAQPVRFD